MILCVVWIGRQKVTDMLKGEGSGNGTGTAAAEINPVSGLPVAHSFNRTGCMASFESFSQFENYFEEILDLLEVPQPSVRCGILVVIDVEEGGG